MLTTARPNLYILPYTNSKEAYIMASATVRISEDSRNTLRELATQEGASMQSVIERAIEQYRRQRFLEKANDA